MSKYLISKAAQDPKRAISECIYEFKRLFGSSDYQPFLILTRSRTGSTFLSTNLDSHPEIWCGGEKLNFLRGRNLDAVVRHIYVKHPAYVKAVGFKIFYYHPNDTEDSRVWELLNEVPNLKVIHLRRRNVIRTLVSRKIAEQTGSYKANVTDSDGTDRVRFTYDELKLGIEDTLQMESVGIERFYDKECMEITYEELVSSSEAKNRIQDFLGVSTHWLTTPLKKQNRGALSDLILDYTELKERFVGSDWEYLFDE